MTPVKLCMVVAVMSQPETRVGDLCQELDNYAANAVPTSPDKGWNYDQMEQNY
ncbi:hypothetical protein [Photorhabdus viridis]|uniref:hypothetical protein n=1 Tax=Photorhabdus viridis TaxID=3163327 RepID=UPI003306F255